MESYRYKKERCMGGNYTSNGYLFTYAQVEAKWRALVKTHKEYSRNSNKTGAKRKDFQYNDEMSEILSIRHDIYMVYIQGSGLDRPRKVNYTIPNEE